MKHNSINQGADLNVSILESLISDYEMAVLSTLFDQEDAGKVIDLARQWGYGQDFLQSVWREIHSPRSSDDASLEDRTHPTSGM